MDELAEYAYGDLWKVRNAFVRWHLKRQAFMNDSFYGNGNLMKVVYAWGFVSRILQQLPMFKSFIKARKYDGSLKSNDLALYLRNCGFHGIFQNNYEHNWVHPSGFQVRVKRKSDNKTEFTIGYTFINPIIWRDDGTPYGLNRTDRLPVSNQLLAFDENNEILKLATDGESLFLIPAFRNRDWSPYWLNLMAIDGIMKRAHFPLPGGFGKFNKQKETFNPFDVQQLLTF